MAFIRYATVRERCFAALIDKLLTIRRINGYNSDVKHVELRFGLPADIEYDANTLYIIIEDSREKQDWTLKIYESVNIVITFYSGRIDNDVKNLEYNLMLGDLKEALYCGLQDPTHPFPETTGIWFTPITEFPQPRVGSNDVVGHAKYRMEYFRSINSGRVWDDVLDKPVEIEE